MNWSKAIVKVINPDVVQVRDNQIAIGYPGGEVGDVYSFKLAEEQDSIFVREKLLDWLEQHLKANGVKFD